jgi:sugar lactone lactonase YvrE
MKKVLFPTILIILSTFIGRPVFAQYINTAAGSGSAGYMGDRGLAVAANLNFPFAVAFDNAGNMYIADELNNVVRRVDGNTGIITTFAGTGVAGFSGDGAAATSARLYGPSGLAVDASGNVYISDQLNNRVRVVSASTGTISTYAGTGTASYTGDSGPATAATLNRPFGLTLDASNNLYIADRNNNVIRMVSASTRDIATVVGSGTVGFSGDGGSALSANLNRPYAIAFNPSGDLYFVDNGNNRVRAVSRSTGVINTVAGTGTASYTGDAGAAASATLNGPSGITFDGSGNYYIADMGNNAVRMVSPSGTITTTTGTGSAGFNGDCISPSAAQLNQPSFVTTDPSGNLTIVDKDNQRVRKIIQPCSGTPSVGTAIASVVDGCPYYGTTLSITGGIISCDFNYQWQSSPDSISFTNLAGATTASYFLAPGSSAYYRCVVTCVNSGLSDTSGGVYLNVNPYPVIGPIVGPSEVCVGTTITLTDTVATGTWFATNTNASVSASGVVTGNTPGLDTIVYFASNFCGTVYDSAFITVNPIVTPSVSIGSFPGTSVCNGSSVTYTANPVNGGTSPGYRWEVNGAFAGSGRVFTYTPLNGDVITVTLSSSAPCPTTVAASASVTMFVTGLLVPSVAISNGLTGDTLCTGERITYFANVTNGGTSPSYVWTVNGTVQSTSPTLSFVYTNGDVLALTITSSFSCASPSTATATKVITVVNTVSPAVAISAFPGDTSCVGYNVTYTAVWRFGGATPNLLWKKNGIAVATGPTYTYMPATGDYVQCILYSSSPCRDADSVFSNIINMTVGPIVTAYATISAIPGTFISVGQSDTIVANVVNGGPRPTYQWYLNGVLVSGATNATFISDAFVDMDSIYCMIRGNNVCATPDYIRTNTLVIRVAPLSISELQNDFAITMVPNPNEGNFSLAGTITNSQSADVQVLNMLGAVVYQATIPLSSGRLSHTVGLTNNIASGSYMVKVSGAGFSKVLRFTLSR